MKKRILLLLSMIFILSAGYALSHEEETDYMLDHEELYPISQMKAFGYGSLAFGIIAAIIIIFNKAMSENTKKLVYFAIVFLVVSVTLYLVIVTLHLNFVSISKGPVHWHADFEIWACDKKIELFEPKGFSNKQGVDLMHAHDDNRMHVEGVLLDEKAASLGAFFYAIGGSISTDGLKVPTDEGIVEYHDGDFCNGQPGKLHVFVNGNLIADPANHVIAPHEKVPPGDMIKVVFTEKSMEQINPNLG